MKLPSNTKIPIDNSNSIITEIEVHLALAELNGDIDTNTAGKILQLLKPFHK